MVKPGQSLIMTEKDAVKCRAFAEDNWWYLPVDAQLGGEQPEQAAPGTACVGALTIAASAAPC